MPLLSFSPQSLCANQVSPQQEQHRLAEDRCPASGPRQQRFVLSNAGLSVIALDIFKTGMTSIRWWKWFTETSQIITVTTQIDKWPPMLLPELYHKTPSSLPHLKHTHTHTHTQLCHCTAIFVGVEPVKQNSHSTILLSSKMVETTRYPESVQSKRGLQQEASVVDCLPAHCFLIHLSDSRWRQDLPLNYGYDCRICWVHSASDLLCWCDPGKGR